MIRSLKVGLRSTAPVIGYTHKGAPVFAIAGGAGDDEGGDEHDEEDEEDDESSGSGDESSKDEDDEDEDQDDEEKPVSREEFNKLQRRMRAADRRADKAEAALRKARKQTKDKGKDDKDSEEVNQRLAQLESDNTALSVQLAVLTTPDAAKFHDPEDVLRFLDFGELTDEDGNIDRDAVGDALSDLAEKKPHLVRNTESKNEKDKDGDDDKPPPSGRQAGRGKQGGNKQLTREALAKKYPALRQR